ncbi:MAG: helix-turn-helix domain-containing protein [Mojavia pulchra JT2-VF2]|jgi:DNA-binding transcriptional regulator YiaG|uniref:Helix-turn-helix domain-containing protein n=1 Tax=Mojavia pulchra JT2-VF2 TaxID=287848 RepID=A0A951UKB3_9NOST|nr:helix-turn-helix domain-containing protein [Mojavia pulchra JT2-VF2]
MQQPAFAQARRMPFAQLVRELRHTMQLSQEKFTELGMTFATINRWENGRATPSALALK